MAETPTRSDISQAKDYIKRRVSAEVKMEHFLDETLLQAAREIVSLAYKWSIPPTLFSFENDPFLSVEVNRIINRLIDEIIEMEMELATASEKEDKKTLAAYVNRDINGANYNDRLQLYADRYKGELEKFIKEGLTSGFTIEQTFKMIRELYKNPYSSPVMAKHKPQGFNAYSRLNLLVRHTIADAWMYADEQWMKRNGAIGYILYRGSGYPCSTCDDATGYHPIDDYVLPLHPNCKCYAVPIYK